MYTSPQLTVSVAAEMSALKPKTQESVLHLIDLGYKPTNERIIRMKNAEGKGEKLDEMELRKILDDKDLKPKQSEPVQQPEAPAPTPGAAPEPPGAAVSQPPIPASPDVPHLLKRRLLQTVDGGNESAVRSFLQVLDVRKYVEKILGSLGYSFLRVLNVGNKVTEPPLDMP